MTDKGRKGTRSTADEVRRDVLEAGRALLAETGGSEKLDIRLSTACRRAGHSPRTASAIWPDHRDYQGDLARYVASSFEWAGPGAIQAEMVDIVTTCTDFDEALRRAAPLYFNHFIGNESFYLALQFWAVRHPSEELVEALASGYDVVHDAFKNMFAGVMMLYGRRLRPPYTLDQLTAALTAVTEGLALRHRIQPATVESPLGDGVPPSSLFAETILAIAHRFTRPASDLEDLVDGSLDG